MYRFYRGFKQVFCTTETTLESSFRRLCECQYLKDNEVFMVKHPDNTTFYIAVFEDKTVESGFVFKIGRDL